MYVHPSVAATITAAAVTGTSVDTQAFRRGAAVFTSKCVGVATTSDCKLQESADNVTFTDVSGGAFAQQTTAGGLTSQILNIDLAKRERYLLLLQTGAGAAAAGAASAVFVLFGDFALAPTQDVTAVSV